MQSIFITSTIFIGLSAAAVATPNHDEQVFWGDSTETEAELAPMLEDWVRETIDSARSEADEMAALAREQGIPAGPARHEVEHRLQFQSPEIVSVLREDWAYGDGANGSLWLIPVNWDARANALIPIQSVLGDPTRSRHAYERVAKLLRDAAVEQIPDDNRQGRGEAIAAAIRPDPMYLSTFTFVPSTVPDRIGGIAWHFEPKVVAPGLDGAISVVIPQEDLREVVAPEWHDMLAGEPVEMSDARYVSSDDEGLQDVLARY